MREQLADIVYPVVAYALQLRERVQRGEQLDMSSEQTRLRSLLNAPSPAQTSEDYTGDADQNFLGIRYALTCWLDELFILHSRWGDQWNNAKLEELIYRTNPQGGWKFWQQAKLAQTRSSLDALEVFYLCVMLGFRGEGPQEETVQAWQNAMEDLVLSGQQQVWPDLPQELKPESNAPPRRGRERLRSAMLLLFVFLAPLIPLIIILFVNRLGGK